MLLHRLSACRRAWLAVARRAARNRRLLAGCTAVCLALSLCPRSSQAVDRLTFGEAGQNAFTGGVGLASFHATGAPSIAFNVSPGILTFVTDHVAVGSALATRVVAGSSSYSVMARFAVDLPLHHYWSIMGHLSLTGTLFVGAPAGKLLSLDVLVPVFLHLGPGGFIGIGPEFRQALYDSAGPRGYEVLLGGMLGFLF